MNRRARLNLTHLEDRLVPAGFGNTWVDTNLTVSFAPDGTDVAGVRSTLFQTLGQRATTQEWQTAIAEAFQAWITPTNLNFSIVPDVGYRLGKSDSVNVGDIRIVARPLSDNILAISNPFDLISPWAGEIIINSNKIFDTDGSTDAYDLKTVLLQEVGHVLGVGNSTNTNSVMYENYLGRRTGLDTQDITAIQTLYGVRATDQYDDGVGNSKNINATQMMYITDVSAIGTLSSSSRPAVVYVDITTAHDVDFFYLTSPNVTDIKNPAVIVETGELSEARLSVTLYYQSPHDPASVIHQIATTSTRDADGRYVLNFTPPGNGWYYIRVKAADNAGVFNVGSYRLAIGNNLTTVPQSLATTNVTTPGGTVIEFSDWVGGKPANDTFETATKLGRTRSSDDSRWDFSGTAKLGAMGDIDFYDVRVSSRSGTTMVVYVTIPAGDMRPRVTVYDSKGKILSTETLYRDGATLILQLTGVKPNSAYFIAVRGANNEKWANQEYKFGIDFRNEPITLDSLTSATLTSQQPQLMREMEVTRSQMFRFQLSATGTSNAGARLSIFDETGKAVFTLASTNGNTVIGDVFLAPGRYRVVIVGGTADGSPLQPLQVFAFYLPLTDPIGPALADDYAMPTAPTTSTSSTPTDSSALRTSSTTSTNDGYYWLTTPMLGGNFLSLTDPYSMVWW